MYSTSEWSAHFFLTSPIRQISPLWASDFIVIHPGANFFFFAFFYWSIIELWGKKHFCSPLDFTYFCTSCRAFSLRRGSEPYPICAFITATDLFLLVRISAILRLRLPHVGSAARPLAAYRKPVLFLILQW